MDLVVFCERARARTRSCSRWPFYFAGDRIIITWTTKYECAAERFERDVAVKVEQKFHK